VTTKSTKDTTAKDTEERRPFAAFLHDLNKGRTHTALSDSLAELVAAVIDTGKPGTLTLRIDVKKLTGTDDQITVTTRVGNKVPTFDAAASVFYVDPDSQHLSRTPPAQPTIFDLEQS
jgi:hypothetical protein